MKTTIEILKAISDKNRARVVSALGHYDELCACQVTELLGVSGATASRHLAVLQQAGWVESRKEGRWIYFSLTRSADRELLLEWFNVTLSKTPESHADLQELKEIVSLTREDLCRRQRGRACCE